MHIVNCQYPYPSYNFVEIRLDFNEVVTPDILEEMMENHPLSDLDLNKGVILSGTAPIWVYSWLTGVYYIVKYIAVFDPKLNAAVVTKTHSPLVKLGEVIKLDETLDEDEKDSEDLKSAVESNQGFTTLETIEKERNIDL